MEKFGEDFKKFLQQFTDITINATTALGAEISFRYSKMKDPKLTRVDGLEPNPDSSEREEAKKMVLRCLETMIDIFDKLADNKSFSKTLGIINILHHISLKPGDFLNPARKFYAEEVFDKLLPLNGRIPIFAERFFRTYILYVLDPKIDVRSKEFIEFFPYMESFKVRKLK